MKKVLFRSFGDSNFGMGHMVRSLSLAQYLKTHHPVEIFFAINENDSLPMSEQLENSSFNKINFQDLPGSVFHYLVHDMPFYDQAFFNSITSIHFENKIGLDYFFYDSNHVNTALNLFNHGTPLTDKFSIKEGIQFAILRESIISKNRFTISGPPQNILITFGSTDPRNNTCEVLKHLPDSQLNINIILGSLYHFEQELEETLKRFSLANIKTFRNVSNIEDYIVENNLIFCGGGTTLLESIHLCRPSIVISQTPEEHNFASSLSKSNLCYVVSRAELNTEKLASLIYADICTATSNACMAVNLGHGKKLIIDELLGKKNG